ncbi:D-isomer specific 2-hydroxyacid dehydrogenase family protein [Oceaniovalibus guishaninsula JLT2003]|uniref:D-isomer specific 2-hydroxyacid dehydrogenase family protein n=1 Tax=Oceaniovalibus guishaninsula JLT2003 TaxID=1231392 RepID=K2I4P3_9RHOB|nr:glyoxylate/hydroxypyruvate reductase A [Oceaniovalibus guishaninsula]EKE43890.1 D-isomer specific 2-hydroxyacid dehydrogenase family protein [Oceaniovalibus guishaninsula JLT2003]
MIRVLFAARDAAWPEWETPLRDAFADAGLDVDLARDHPADKVDYIVLAPNGPVGDFAPFTACKAVLNLWAGVEDVVHNPTLTQPLARMVDPGLTQGMVEYVTGHVLRHHLGLDAHLHGQDGQWRPDPPPLAADRRVGILGLGALGLACADMLRHLGFDVAGWSRRLHDGLPFPAFAGQDGLATLLRRSDILVLLLPLTDATRHVLNATTLAQLPMGAVVLNPGRGGLIDDAALLAALDTGQVGHATLDTFTTEPLPPDHPFWAHPGVTVTPHIASATRPVTAARTVAENIRRGEAGEPLLHLVDRKAGY